MRLILCLFIFLVLAQPVGAQCVDIPSCKGAEVESRERRLQYARETEEAKPTSTPRPTRTPAPTMTATDTPRPSATAEPTRTQTPQPVATVTAMPSVTEIAVMPTIAARVAEALKADKPEPLPAWVKLTIQIVGVLLGLTMFLWSVAKIRKNA